jgi:hypothetical protein
MASAMTEPTLVVAGEWCAGVSRVRAVDGRDQAKHASLRRLTASRRHRDSP